MSFSLGVDIGGTFTDCVAIAADGRVLHAKTLSTHDSSPSDGVIAGLEQLASEAGVSLEQLLEQADRLSHGTTIGTNLVVERNGARVGLLATQGHGDALLMMRGNGRTAGVSVEDIFSVRNTSKPEPLVPRELVVEVPERITADGTVLAPLDDARAREAVRAVVGQGVDAVAVCLLWSLRNDVHEEKLRALIAEEAPDAFVSISSQTAPRQGEYERTVATVINAYVGPRSSAYLTELADRLREKGLRRSLFVMQANGGVVPVDVASRLPVQTIGSGPAGGLAAALQVAGANGHDNVIATDMGGTSFEVGLIIDGRAIVSSDQVIDRYRFTMPQLDVRSIACGGGSIARVDEHAGTMRVGPESAGSDPGPACYGRGSEPTVTDADVVLGLIDPARFLGGQMELDADAARGAVARVADALGLSVEEAAAGIVRLNDHSAATLIRQRTIEQGLDPRDFVLYAFGGAGPVHAFGYAEELGVREVVVPLGNGASTLSAYGIAASDVMRPFEVECSVRAPFDMGELTGVLTAAGDQAHAAMRDAGFDGADVELEYEVLMRYAEQLLSVLALPVDAGALESDHLAGRFDAEYTRLYGEGARAVFQAIEIFAVRVTARVRLAVGELAPDDGGADGAGAASQHSRDVYWPRAGTWVPTAVHDGLALEPGATVDGPAIVELPHTTVAVADGQRLRRDGRANLVLTIAR